jgi:Resolvase, N terminal domain/YfiR/HmsC-like
MKFVHSNYADEYELKAAFLFKFAKFTVYPQSTFANPQSSFAICVLGQNPFGHFLDDAFLNRRIAGRSVVVERLKDNSGLTRHGRGSQRLRAALYARVSTLNNGQSPEMQIRDFGEYCQRRGWTATEYVDVGVSGAKDRRPELDRLMVDAHQRRFDVVAVWKFDRFARSVSHLLRAKLFQ